MDIINIIPLFMGLRGTQLIVVLLVILLIFGAARLPKIMRNLGKGVHSFKQGLEDAKEEMNKPIRKHDAPSAKAKDIDRDNDGDI